LPIPVAAGSIVAFSSLTPHCTGPNRTGDVRKAYIVQYAAEGAEVLLPDGQMETERIRADAPDRQFPVLANGLPVA
jgi:ectoine hydroxylase-related dioxygenase (phytanoyl-CoA dioxygenase family)